MSRVYDNWERLVEATLKRDQLRQIALCPSLSSSSSIDFSLDSLDFVNGRYQSLSWATRIKVATGAARALSFLHGLEKQVIHRSFNSGDILLDGEFNAKLSDFGLARNGPTGHLTTKCDVYSFGVVLLESLTGRSVLDMLKARHKWNLVNWAQPYLLHKIKLKRIMDTKLEGQYPQNGVYTVATVACKCISQDPRKRPTMAEDLVELQQL
ncbi:hypothetical protein RD792_018058 [Penstemon davidsonii]|uniref:Protein kinase domain-containing protein n=1 Tax=Penstemon davidsonii TaxID=160366 RepID=A0ABR0DV87_9LAMI|nr:hypothetical protein RD792_018058 [Penstemon davidsonii]